MHCNLTCFGRLALLGAAFAISICQPAFADISLPKIFSDHMVMQRNSDVSVWGTANPNQKLSVTFGDQPALKTTADGQGNWSVTIATPEAGGPYTLTIVAAEGQPQVMFSNIMIGDVWLCSGQSNMEWEVAKSLNAETEIELSKNYPNLRLFSVAHGFASEPQSDFAKVDPWQVCGPESSKDFSATAYYFGRELSKELTTLPIGLIDSSWGGTTCEAWTSQSTLLATPGLEPLMEYWKSNDSPNNRNRPANLFNGMIAPLRKFPVRGVIWYQGEANNGRGHQYATLFPALIEDWRRELNSPELPFYFAQIAPYRYSDRAPEGLAEIWEAQIKTLRNVPHTGMAVTSDIGDINDIHPKNKQAVGHRLAAIALAQTYREELPSDHSPILSSGPLFARFEKAGDRIRVSFDHVGDGLQIKGDGEALNCFSICGADKKFVPAMGRIVDGVVELHAVEVPAPEHVRFAWTDTAEPNLVNSAGLPALPFRTDDFPLQSVGREF